MGHFKDVKISTLKLDVTSDGEVSGVVESVLEREGRIDIVVNNAGRPHSGGLRTSIRRVRCPDLRLQVL